MTPEVLATCTGARIDRARTFAPFITDAMAEYDISNPARQAMFLANVGHESGGLHWTTELWGPTTAQLRYEGRFDLGNNRPGDGYLFRGRGLIQTTGRANYARTGHALGLDLEATPDLLATPKLAARSAACFWAAHGLNTYADAGEWLKVVRKINGGTNGLDDRTHLWNVAKAALETK